MAAHIQLLDFEAINLAAEFDLAYRKRTQAHQLHLADVGVTFDAMLRAGDLGVERIATTGRIYTPSSNGFPAMILALWSPAPPSIYTAVENPEILDLLALRLDQPDLWWRRTGDLGMILGEHRYLDAIDRDKPLKVFDSPVAWLRGDCGGCVLLDDAETRWTNERNADDRGAPHGWWEAVA